jgi:hypothetical protein
MKNIVSSFGRTHSRCGFFIVAVALCWYALSPALNAGCPNPPGVCFGQNTAVGQDALFNVTTGVWNVGIGVQALFNDTIGNQNTAIGYQTLFTNVDGDHSTGIGSQALFNNTTGSDNVGVGFRTIYTNTTGSRNTGMGFRTLAFSDTGSDNTAVGWNALYNDRSGGGSNTAVGSQALFSNTSGSGNVGIGFQALFSNTTQGVDNTDGTSVAIGYQALQNNLEEDNNAIGHQALQNNTTGFFNNAFGWHALQSNVTGSSNTAIGDFAGESITGSGNICIGAGVSGVPGESFVTRIGNIEFTPFTTGGFFLYEVNGAIGIFTSSRKFKDDIKPIDKASETIYSLNPVTFRAKPEADPSRPRGYGLIAEDVEKMNPDLVSHGQNDILTVRYESINAMLLNEFLKEHKKVEEQQASISELKSTVALQQKEMQVLTAQLKEQATQIQKVSAQLQTTKPAPQSVAINP